MNSDFISKYRNIIFISILLIVYWLFNYQQILFLSPQSYHTWRQTDCLSMTLNYFNFNLPLLEPELHHFYGIGGKNVGEFPILYYLAAQLYGLFNQTEMWLRLLNLSIFSIGLYCLYSTIFKMTKNLILAFCGPLLIFNINNNYILR